ncbi:DUF58 domain-containing protein [Gymnodinialimonas sp. 2305UL16-5]|uniref:DUF58 domain-containing protein n=1 Tax=Gymnodinialimonas mytili TaxID=3126503 RepID=UPI003094AE3F
MAALDESLRQAIPFLWLALGVFAICDLVASRAPRQSVGVDAPTEVFVGENLVFEISFETSRPGVTGRIEWPDGIEGPTEFTFTDGSATLDLKALRRGVWQVDRLWLSWESRFGLFEFVPRLALAQSIRVVPNIRRVRSGEISTRVESTLYGVKENFAIGEGSEFHQLRDFVPGMDVKTIDWKRSARTRSLVARELRAERNHHVIIALDNGYLMGEDVAGVPKIDHAVTAALATAWAAAVGGDLVGYFSYDVRPRSYFAPEPGRIAFARMRSWAAELDYVRRETNHTLALTELGARTKKRSLIIIFTDFVDVTSAELLVENISLLAKRHLVVFVAIRDTSIERYVDEAPQDLDSVAMLVAANQSIAERRLVLERLNRIGVTVIDADPKSVTPKLITAYLEIKARELI